MYILLNRFCQKPGVIARNHVLAEDVIDTSTGEVLANAGEMVTAEMADAIQNAAVPYVCFRIMGCHSFPNGSFQPGQTDTVLILKKFSHRSDTPCGL